MNKQREGNHSEIYTWSASEKEIISIYNEAYKAAKEIISIARLQKDDVLVVGCSTSEVCGAKIGSESRPEVASEIYRAIAMACSEAKIYLAAQCCEHLNRAIIIEQQAAKENHYEIVNVVPVPKAGGAFASIAYHNMNNPVAVEHIKANAGLDIGDTLIGMHLKNVAVPVRLSINKIGEAHLVAARTRAKYIGGSRAEYNPDLS